MKFSSKNSIIQMEEVRIYRIYQRENLYWSNLLVLFLFQLTLFYYTMDVVSDCLYLIMTTVLASLRKLELLDT